MDNLTVLVPYRNGAATIERLLDSLPRDVSVIVIDDVSAELYQSNRDNVRVVRLSERGYFSGACNRGFAECQTDVLILNQDVWFADDRWLQVLAANRAQFAIIGDGVMGHPAWSNGYIQGTAMFIRRDALDAVGGFDERHYPLWGATCLFQLQACRAGFAALPIAPSAEVLGLQHERGAKQYGASITQALKDEPDKQDLFIRTPPAISVVITSYNYGAFLREAVASLVGGQSFVGALKPQTFQSFEIVLVDYGSTDDTWAIMQSLADDWQGIRAIQTQDEGTAAACNAGIEVARGKYIAMLDADDAMESNRLELMYRAAIENPHAVVYDDIRLCFAGVRGEDWKYPDYDFELVLEKNIMHKGLLFPKQAWKEIGGYPRIMTDGREDWAFNIALGVAGWCGVHIKLPLYLARRGAHNRSSRNTNPLWHQKFLEKLHLLFPSIYAGERPVGCCGGRRRAPKNNIAPGKPIGVAKVDGRLPGADGMTLIEYTAPDSAELRCFHGSETSTPYWFGQLRRRGYVDTRDAGAFLKFMMGRAFEAVSSGK